MTNNRILNYTGWTYEELRDQIAYELNKDPNFENFRDSSIAQTIIDIFAATTDFTNYYLERRAEEQFLETAQLRSSVISLANLLGYVPQRPIPAESALSIILKGPLPAGMQEGETITFQKHNTAFVGNNKSFILKYNYTYTFTSDDISDGVGNDDWTKTINYGVTLSSDSEDVSLDDTDSVPEENLEDITIIQGEIKVYEIEGTESQQTGQIFQKYVIPDNTFSNYFGNEDLGYDSINETESLSENLTKVGIGTTQSEALSSVNLWSIDRRSLINPSKITTSGTAPKVALIKTTYDDEVKVYFGDDRISEIGIQNSSENLYIQYFSTLGKSGNAVGVVGKALTTSNSFYTNGDVDGTIYDLSDNVEFKFFKNIVNGSDMESVDSIKLNAPSIYYSLDRLISTKDYVSYLKTQRVGDDGEFIKNAVAWGEQEEIRSRGQEANFRFLNVGFFSCLGPLYRFPKEGEYSIYSSSDIHNSYLETSADFSSVSETTSGVVSADGYPEQSYFNIFVKESPASEVTRAQDFRSISSSHPIYRIYDKLYNKSILTIQHIYVTPFVQKFRLKGRINIGKLEDRVGLRKEINNEIYEWLNNNVNFETKIYLSDLYEIIQNYQEVKNSNLYFEPVVPTQLITTWESDNDFVDGVATSTSAAVKNVFDTYINSYLTSAGFANLYDINTTSATEDYLSLYETSASTLMGGSNGIWNNPYGTIWYYEHTGHVRVGSITERSFYTTLMKNIYDNLSTSYLTPGGNIFRDSQYFKNIMYKLHNDLVGVIRTSMLDTNGNIVNYSMSNEIAQIQTAMSYTFV